MGHPEKISGVEIVLKANIYFDDGVISHTILHSDGRKQTVGSIRAGKYHFNTDAAEQMDILAGTCSVILDGAQKTQVYSAGQTFYVPAKSGFTITVEQGLAEYLCSFDPKK